MTSSNFNMPGIQDWRRTPLVNVSQIFEEHTRSRNPEHAGSNENVWKTKVSDFFAQKLNITSASEEWKKEIPSLNAIPNHLLIDGQLVRFQGMIQVRNSTYVPQKDRLTFRKGILISIEKIDKQ